jgi:hypothetical protein
MACLWRKEALFADAEAGKDTAKQIIGAKCTGNFTQRLLRLTQIFGQQLTSTGKGQLRATVLE